MIEWGETWSVKSMDFICNPIEKDARINILEGSVRSSKTVSMIPKWINYIKNGPKGLLLMTGVSKDTIHDNVLDDLFDTVGPKNYKYNRMSGDLKIYGRKIKVIGAKDEGSEKYLRGKTLAGAYCDEITMMPEKFFKQLLNRLSIGGAKLYATTNPDSPFHYLYKDYITNKKMLASGIVKVIHFILEDNPNLSHEYVEFIKQAYSGLFYKRMILGLWVLAEGIIYDQFNQDTMCVSDDEVPDMVHYWVGVDYGTSNATTFLLGGFGVDKKFYALKEYYHSGKESLQKSPSQYSKELIKWLDNLRDKNNFKIKPEKIFIDPSAEAFVIQLYEDGVRNVVSADNRVKLGIELVSNLMGADKFRVNKSCHNLLEELSSYIWDAKAQKLGEDKPVKAYDHVLDGLRYQIMSTRTIWNRYVN